MKILEAPIAWVRKFRCTECNALLEVEEADIEIGNFGVGWGMPEIKLRFYFVCPVCSANRFVDSKEMPAGMYEKKVSEWHERDTERKGLVRVARCKAVT